MSTSQSAASSTALRPSARMRARVSASTVGVPQAMSGKQLEMSGARADQHVAAVLGRDRARRRPSSQRVRRRAQMLGRQRRAIGADHQRRAVLAAMAASMRVAEIAVGLPLERDRIARDQILERGMARVGRAPQRHRADVGGDTRLRPRARSGAPAAPPPHARRSTGSAASWRGRGSAPWPERRWRPDYVARHSRRRARAAPDRRRRNSARRSRHISRMVRSAPCSRQRRPEVVTRARKHERPADALEPRRQRDVLHQRDRRKAADARRTPRASRTSPGRRWRCR